jgi:ribosome-binding ATPase YchF (GTP1/OBG family)
MRRSSEATGKYQTILGKCVDSAEEAEYYTNELLDNVQNMEEEIHRQFSPIFIVSDVVVVDDVASVDKTNITICVDNKLPKVSGAEERIITDPFIYEFNHRLYTLTNCP